MNPNLGTETLRRLSHLLEEFMALELDAVEPWLRSLSATDGACAQHLRKMLAAQRRSGHTNFLATFPTLTDSDQPPAPQVGTNIGGYSLLRHMGYGGMGSVWQARDQSTGQRVALKLHRRPRALGAAAQVAYEARITALMDHPRVARLRDSGVDATQGAFLVLDWIEASPLNFDSNPRLADAPSRLRMFERMLQTVMHVHERGVVHCDLKPSNFLLAVDESVHLIDFGIATTIRLCPKHFHSPISKSLTPAYASPEQTRGDATTPACDVKATLNKPPFSAV